MIKKEYLKPTMNVVELKYKRHILVGSLNSARADGLDEDFGGYDSNGGDASNAW